MAGFSDMETLLTSYMGAGFIPILSPIRAIPPLLRFFNGFVVDKWKSAERLSRVVARTQNRLRLTFIHAKNDREIPCHESDTLFRFAAGAVAAGGEDSAGNFDAWKEERTQRTGDSFVSVVVASKPDIIIRQELVRHGGKYRAPLLLVFFGASFVLSDRILNPAVGHNDIMLSSQVALAVLRSFEAEAEQTPILQSPKTTPSLT